MACPTARLTISGRVQGVVGIVTRERPVGWEIESMRYHRANVVSCEPVTRLIMTSLVVMYLSLSMIENLPDLEEALKLFKNPIVLGDLNVDLNEANIP